MTDNFFETHRCPLFRGFTVSPKIYLITTVSQRYYIVTIQHYIIISSTHYRSLAFYFIPSNHQKTSGFPMFSGRYRKRLVAWKGSIKTLYYYILNHHSSLIFFYKVACTRCYSPTKNYRFKVNNKNTKGMYEIYSKFTVKTPEGRRRSGVFIVNFEHISRLVLVFLLLT